MNSVDSVKPNGQAFVNLLQDGLCSKCTILAGHTGLVFEDGSLAGPDQGVHINHIFSVDVSKQSMMAVLSNDAESWDPTKIPNIRSLATGFIGQGEHNRDEAILFTTIDGKYNSGYHVMEKDIFFVTVSFLSLYI